MVFERPTPSTTKLWGALSSVSTTRTLWPALMVSASGRKWFWRAAWISGVPVPPVGVLAAVGHGVAVATFGMAMLALYVDLTTAEFAALFACSCACYVLEGLVAAIRLWKAARPVRAWLAGESPAGASGQAEGVWFCAA